MAPLLVWLLLAAPASGADDLMADAGIRGVRLDLAWSASERPALVWKIALE
jgi:hypothetical protein